MKRLTLPAARYRRHLRQALVARELVRYSATIDSACALAHQYSRRSPELQTIQTSIKNGATHSFFVGLYDRNRKSVKAIRKSVRDGLSNATAARCQYCGFPAGDTLDHFLEKAIIPELSLFTRNLIPCCSYCNRTRGPTFAPSGERRVLHFYYDDVDAMPEVLLATVAIATGSGTPVASYSITHSSNPMVEVYRRHFDAVHLRERYESEAAVLILSVRENVQRWMPLTPAGVETELRALAATDTKIFGKNNHTSALYRGLADEAAAIAWLMAP